MLAPGGMLAGALQGPGGQLAGQLKKISEPEGGSEEPESGSEAAQG
jgi:hypothetical protein